LSRGVHARRNLPVGPLSSDRGTVSLDRPTNAANCEIVQPVNVSPAHVAGWVGAGAVSWIPVLLTVRALAHLLT